MIQVKVVGRGIDTLVLNVCYTNKQFHPIKQELAVDLQNELDQLQNAAKLNEAPELTHWAFKGINLFMQEKGSRGQWRWILKSPLLTLAISRGRLSRIIAQVRLSSEYLWSCEYLAEAIVEACASFLTCSVTTSGSRFQQLTYALMSSGGMCRKPIGRSVSYLALSAMMGDLVMKRCWLRGLMWCGEDGSALKHWILASIPLLCRAASITRQPRSGRNHPARSGFMICGSAMAGTVRPKCGALSFA